MAARKTTPALVFALFFLTGILWPMETQSQRPRLGIAGQQAPPWQVEKWWNLPEGVEALEPGDLEGKVIYLFAFQSWCPGCHSHGFPTLKKVMEYFSEESEVVFVAVQTTFEGHASNTPDRALESVEEYDLVLPVGHVEGTHGETPSFMRRYRTGGTPWTVIIDRRGRVRFNDFSIGADRAVVIVKNLLEEPVG